MQIRIHWKGQMLFADLSKPLQIAIPLQDGAENQPNAYAAPLFRTTPYESDNFIGSINAGSPVNYYNVQLNPHGNGTHTESIGHISQGDYAIHNCLKSTHVIAELVSVHPTQTDEGDNVIRADALSSLRRYNADALIVRTLPNPNEKQSRKYTGTNPPYFSAKAMHWIQEQGYNHLLTDLPSVDREEDDGTLEAHRIFWQLETSPRVHSTITEMIFVANDIKDGIYLLNIQIAALILDASPSRPVLFKLNTEY